MPATCWSATCGSARAGRTWSGTGGRGAPAAIECREQEAATPAAEAGRQAWTPETVVRCPAAGCFGGRGGLAHVEVPVGPICTWAAASSAGSRWAGPTACSPRPRPPSAATQSSSGRNLGGPLRLVGRAGREPVQRRDAAGVAVDPRDDHQSDERWRAGRGADRAWLRSRVRAGRPSACGGLGRAAGRATAGVGYASSASVDLRVSLGLERRGRRAIRVFGVPRTRRCRTLCRR